MLVSSTTNLKLKLVFTNMPISTGDEKKSSIENEFGTTILSIE